jgi:type VI secretion system protein ImpE
LNVKQLLDAGQLAEALAQLNQEVRAHPLDVRSRTALFEVLCFAGDYDRAQRQLEALAGGGVQQDVGVQAYRAVLTAERSRQHLFDKGLAPGFLMPPPDFVQAQLEAINRLREDRRKDARALLEQAAAMQTPIPGQLGEQRFDDLSDAEPVLGPVLELFINDRYTWLPLVQLNRLSLSKPQRWRDLLWLPVNFETIAGTSAGGFMPVLYCGSHRHPDDQVKLGRMTVWEEIGEGLSRGAGRRLFFIDDTERSPLELQEIIFDNPSR